MRKKSILPRQWIVREKGGLEIGNGRHYRLFLKGVVEVIVKERQQTFDKVQILILLLKQWLNL